MVNESKYRLTKVMLRGLNDFQGFYRNCIKNCLCTKYIYWANLKFKADSSQLCALPMLCDWRETRQWLKCHLFWHMGGPTIDPEPPALLPDQIGLCPVPGHQRIFWLCFVTMCAQGGCDLMVEALLSALSRSPRVAWTLLWLSSMVYEAQLNVRLRGATAQCRGMGLCSKMNQDANSWLFCEPVLRYL